MAEPVSRLAHEKVGHTGKGLWGRKNWQLPAYIQHVANDLIESGHPESQAVHMAVGLIQKWARGGAGVKPDTRAKAAAALAEWEALKAKAKVRRSTVAGTKKHDVAGGGSVSRADLIRFYPLEDIHIVRSSEDAGTDGRTVEAYAAVFGQESEIEDEWGHYLETIDPGAFNRRLDHVKRSRAGLGQIKVLYNHGMTVHGSPSERFSMPIGVPADITAEARGLLTRTRYNQTPLADEVLENIRAGSITSQSFVGPMMRCTPMPRRYGRYAPDASGQLTTVRRTELGLRDYGPVVFPAYSGAEILGVRMSLPGERYAAAEGEFEDEALPPDEGLAAGDPLTDDGEHSARYHQHALYVLRAKEMREKAGLAW